MRKKWKHYIDRMLTFALIGILLPLFITIIWQRMRLEEVIYGTYDAITEAAEREGGEELEEQLPFILAKEIRADVINAWEVLTGSSTIQIGGQCCNQHCTSSHPDDLVGAHVVLSQPTQALQPDEEFYIVPLCRGCNSSGPGKNIQLRCAVKAARMSWIGK